MERQPLSSQFISFHQVLSRKTEIGVGQASFTHYRYQNIDYLPWMYMYTFPFCSRRPKEVASFFTIIRPFDGYTWMAAIIASAIFYLTLVATQTLYAYRSGRPFQTDHLYEGIGCARQYHIEIKSVSCPTGQYYSILM